MYLDTMCEVVPEVVSTTMAAALHLYDASTALIAVVEVLSKPVGFSLPSYYKRIVYQSAGETASKYNIQ